MKDAEDLARLRNKIDALDDHILYLLQRRAETALEVGRLKKNIGRSIYDFEREKQIIDRLTSAINWPLAAEDVETIFQAIIKACRSIQG